MTSFPDLAMQAIEASFRSVDSSSRFGRLDEMLEGIHFARSPGSSEPFLVPYLPLIGNKFEPGGLLVLATAQSFSEARDTRAQWWGQYVGYGEDAMYRLYRQSPDDSDPGTFKFSRRPSQVEQFKKENVSIGPIASGVLLAMAGLFLYSRDAQRISDLNDVLEHVAVGNLYKFTLMSGTRDVNPKDLPDPAARDWYAQEMVDAYVMKEIQSLQPGAIMTFDVPARYELARHLAGPGNPLLVTVRDPAALRRGWKHERWRRQLLADPLPAGVRALVEGYVEQCDDYHRRSKREKTEHLLSVSYSEFEESRLKGHSSA